MLTDDVGFSQKLSDLTVRCGGVYSKPILGKLLVEGIDLRTHIKMRRWWADNRDAALDVLVHTAQSMLVLQGSQREPAAKEECQHIKLFRRKKKGQKGRRRKRHIMEV